MKNIRATFENKEEAARFETTMEELGKLNYHSMYLSPHPNIAAEDFLNKILHFSNKEHAIVKTAMRSIINYEENAKIQEVITEIGICYSVNSPLSQYLSPQ